MSLDLEGADPARDGTCAAAADASTSTFSNAAAGYVLAGGMSSRMGADKALVQLAGRPLIDRTLQILRDAGLQVSIAGARSGVSGFAPVIEDPDPGLGPLSGVCSALAAASAPYAIFLPVDLPLLPSSLIVYLLDHAQITSSPVTLVSVNGFPQTFPAILDRATLPALSAELRSGRAGCFSAFQSAAASLALPLAVLPVEFLVQSGRVSHPHALPPALWFLNVNTPGDLQRAEGLLSSGIA